MRKDWEVYSIKDLGKVVTGSTPSTKNELNYSSKDYSFVKPSDISQSQISYIDETECYVSEYAFQNGRILPSGTVLVTCIGIIGKVGIIVNDCICNQQINAVIPNEKVDNKFLAYSIFYRKDMLSLIANAPVVPIINKTDFSNIKLFVPPLQTQQQIVEELDYLTSIIEKLKKQLEELDNLTQSIFYDMFGDPIENEKGWGKEKITKVAPIEPYQGDIPEMNGMYWLLNLDMIQSNKRTIYEKVYVQYDEVGTSTIKFNKDNVLYSKLRPYLNKVVIPDESGFCTSELVPFKPNESIILKIFLCYVLSHKCFVDYINSKVIGAKMPRVSMNVLREFNVITPPSLSSSSLLQR